jgi:hypothetical protein
VDRDIQSSVGVIDFYLEMLREWPSNNWDYLLRELCLAFHPRALPLAKYRTLSPEYLVGSPKKFPSM